MSDVVALVRATLVEQLTPWLEPHELVAVLQRLDTVPHDDDAECYVAVAVEVARAAMEAAVTPRLNRLRAEAVAIMADADRLEAQYAAQQRAFEEFRRTKAPKTIH
jgi:hypothetical protein